MTEFQPDPPVQHAAPGAPHQPGGMLPAYAGAAPLPAVPMGGPIGPIGKVRSTGMCILLAIVTLGIYPLVWYVMVHGEMKDHAKSGLGGGLAFVLAFFVGIVMPFITPHEIEDLYKRRGQESPVSAVTGLWVLLLGWCFGLGAIIWFVKVNGALNDYWRSLGAE